MVPLAHPRNKLKAHSSPLPSISARGQGARPLVRTGKPRNRIGRATNVVGPDRRRLSLLLLRPTTSGGAVCFPSLLMQFHDTLWCVCMCLCLSVSLSLSLSVCVCSQYVCVVKIMRERGCIHVCVYVCECEESGSPR